MNLPQTISTGAGDPQGLFVTNNGDIYIGSSQPYYHVEKWTLNSTVPVIVMNVTGLCFSLFVDINNTLYCSLGNGHLVLKTSLIDNGSIPITAAGNGTSGLAPDMLNDPRGIYVDTTFNLYVADSGNNRIQMFPLGQLNGTTLAGIGAPGTIVLSAPTAVILDAAGYLFIVEYSGNRIVGTSPVGYRCLVGCSGSGSSSSQLNAPYSFSFDSSGNIFVIDSMNQRIQKFSIDMNVCGKHLFVFLHFVIAFSLDMTSMKKLEMCQRST